MIQEGFLISVGLLSRLYSIHSESEVFSLLLVTGAFATTTRCVNVTGSGGCFSTIQSAVTASAEGDIVSIYPGVYFERVYIDKAGLTLMGTTSSHGGTGTIIDAYPYLAGTSLGSAGHGIYIDGVDRVTIKNLTVRNAAFPYSNIYSTGNYTTISNVNIYSAGISTGIYAALDGGGSSGIYIDGNNAKITNCNIANNFSYAVYIAGDMAILQYNTMAISFDGVYVNGSAPLITNNSISEVGGSAPLITNNSISEIGGSSCLYVERGADNGVVKNNKISYCQAEGIYYDTSNNVTISGNTVSFALGTCIDLYLTNSKIQSNGAEFCVGAGISNYTTGKNTYSGNTVKLTLMSGMDIYDDNPAITGNSVTNACASGYYIDGYTSPTGGLISSNYAGYSGYCGFGFDNYPDNVGVSGFDNYLKPARFSGYDIYLDNATISGNTAEYNIEDGFHIGSYTKGNNTITKNISRSNGFGVADFGYGGFYIHGDGQYVNLNQALNNGAYGFYLDGDMTVIGNTANNNFGTGIHLEDTAYDSMTVSGNTAKNNQGEGIVNDIITEVATVNVTNNVATGNRLDICRSSGSAIWTTFTGNTFVTGGKTTDCDFDVDMY